MEKLKEAVIEFNKKELTYDLELHVHDPNIYPQRGLHLLTSEKENILILVLKLQFLKICLRVEDISMPLLCLQGSVFRIWES